MDSIRNHGKHTGGDLTASKLNLAENVIIKFDQAEISHDKFAVMKKSLDLFFDDDGIIRVKGRLENSDLDVETKFPILLKGDHYFNAIFAQG